MVLYKFFFFILYIYYYDIINLFSILCAKFCNKQFCNYVCVVLVFNLDIQGPWPWMIVYQHYNIIFICLVIILYPTAQGKHISSQKTRWGSPNEERTSLSIAILRQKGSMIQTWNFSWTHKYFPRKIPPPWVFKKFSCICWFNWEKKKNLEIWIWRCANKYVRVRL